MLEGIKKIKENKLLKIIWNVIYTFMFLIVLLMLLVVVMQRVTDNSITIGGIRMFTVATGSMKPVYEVGDVLISKEIEPEEIKVGDDIVYRGKKSSFSGKIITHRVISIDKQEDGNYKIVTKGTANQKEDPEINQTQVYGKIIYKVKTLSYIGRITQDIYVFYFIIFVPIGLLIFKQIKNIVNCMAYRKQEDNKEENNEENSKNN